MVAYDDIFLDNLINKSYKYGILSLADPKGKIPQERGRACVDPFSCLTFKYLIYPFQRANFSLFLFYINTYFTMCQNGFMGASYLVIFQSL